MKKEEYNSKIMGSIVSALSQLDEIDDYFENLPIMQSRIDEELSDLLHFIEDNNLTSKQSSNIVKLIQKKRGERRQLYNDYEIKKIYMANRSKIGFDGQRASFTTEIMKKENELNQQYRYRQFGGDETDAVKRCKLAEQQIKDILNEKE